MPTQGEFEYFKKIGEGGMRHAAGKPWSDPDWDETKALESAYRALQPGGICITSEPGIGNARRSKQVIREFGTTERDMERGRIIRAGRALYRQLQGEALARVFGIPVARSLASIFSNLLYKHAAGIVVLRK